jgi:hypothetical protein
MPLLLTGAEAVVVLLVVVLAVLLAPLWPLLPMPLGTFVPAFALLLVLLLGVLVVVLVLLVLLLVAVELLLVLVVAPLPLSMGAPMMPAGGESAAVCACSVASSSDAVMRAGDVPGM